MEEKVRGEGYIKDKVKGGRLNKLEGTGGGYMKGKGG